MKFYTKDFHKHERMSSSEDMRMVRWRWTRVYAYKDSSSEPKPKWTTIVYGVWSY